MASNTDNLSEQLIEAENSHDIEKMLSFMTDDDVLIEDVSFGTLMKAKEGVKQSFSGFYAATPDFKVQPKSQVTSNRSFAVEVTFTETQTGALPCLPAKGRASLSRDVALENLKTAR
jgi:hypothetical protein